MGADVDVGAIITVEDRIIETGGRLALEIATPITVLSRFGLDIQPSVARSPQRTLAAGEQSFCPTSPFLEG
jgi:hypothetical protein